MFTAGYPVANKIFTLFLVSPYQCSWLRIYASAT